MLLQCTNMYAGTGHSNTKYNMKYNLFALGSLRDTLCRFAKVNHELSTQLSIIITSMLTPNCACRAVNPRIHYVGLTVTSSECLKHYLNP